MSKQVFSVQRDIYAKPFVFLPLDGQGDTEQKNPTSATLESGSFSGDHLNPRPVVLAASANASNLSHHTLVESLVEQDDDCPIDLNGTHDSFAYEEGACKKTSAKGNEDTETVPFSSTLIMLVRILFSRAL